MLLRFYVFFFFLKGKFFKGNLIEKQYSLHFLLVSFCLVP